VSVVNGLPAHILLVHFIVVLAPLTAILALGASVWPAIRRRLVWLIAALAVITLVLTPLTTEAGEWLEERVPETGAVETHAELGDSMLFFALGLVVVAALLVALHVREGRGTGPVRWQSIAVVVITVVVAAATIVQVIRIGESGARAAWENTVSTAPAEDGSDE
jgi:uncharacterized membrane protein